MASPKSTPSIAETIEAYVRRGLEVLRGPIPAAVQIYSAVTREVTVTPVVGFVVDGEVQTPPTIQNVPVAFPGGSLGSITWPLAPGDTVYLLPAESDFGAWYASGAPEPLSKSRFSLKSLVAIPGPRSLVSPLPADASDATALVVKSPDIRLGSATAVNFVALANLVLTELGKIATSLSTHKHGGVTTGAGLTGISDSSYTASSVAATKVKAE